MRPVLVQLLAQPASGEKIIFPLLSPMLHAYVPVLETLKGVASESGGEEGRRGISCPVSIIYGSPDHDWMPQRSVCVCVFISFGSISVYYVEVLFSSTSFVLRALNVCAPYTCVFYACVLFLFLFLFFFSMLDVCVCACAGLACFVPDELQFVHDALI